MYIFFNLFNFYIQLMPVTFSLVSVASHFTTNIQLHLRIVIVFPIHSSIIHFYSHFHSYFIFLKLCSTVNCHTHTRYFDNLSFFFFIVISILTLFVFHIFSQLFIMQLVNPFILNFILLSLYWILFLLRLALFILSFHSSSVDLFITPSTSDFIHLILFTSTYDLFLLHSDFPS